MSLADVNTEMAAAVAALKSANYATALTRAICAQGLIAAIPDSVGPDSTQLEWNFDRIKEFVASVRREKATAAATTHGGFQRTKVNYVVASD